MSEFHDVFISYGRADSKAFCIQLYHRLLEHGLKVWFDQNDIPLAVDFQNQIDDGLEKSDNFIFVISPHSINSIYCAKEIELALKRNKRIIPLLHIEKIDQGTWQRRNPNAHLSEWKSYQEKGLDSCFSNMNAAIAKINWVNVREGIDDFETSFAGLLKIFDRDRNYVHQHTLLLDKALTWEKNYKQSSHLLIAEERSAAETWLKHQFKDEQPPCEPTDLHCEFICESTKNANGLMTQVFLSYANQDRAFMHKIAHTLMRESITVWTNKTDIQTGTEFEQLIQHGIEEADNVVFLISIASLASKYCHKELTYARSRNKRIIPLLIQDVPIETIPADLRSLQFIHFPHDQEEVNYQADAAKLIRILEQDQAYYEQHKVLLSKALKWERQNQNPSILLRDYSLRQAEAWLAVAKVREQQPPTTLQTSFITTSLQQPPDQSLDVFISYSRTDSDFARKLNDALQLQGKATWFDQENIISASDFQQEIHRGIETSNTFLFILSPSSVKSPYCAEEVEYVKKLNKRIVTILHRPIDSADLHPALANIQWIDFDRYQGDFYTNFSELIRTLDTDLDYRRVHTRLLMRALEWQQEGYDPSFLLRGRDLKDSERWLKSSTDKTPPPADLHSRYIRTSRQIPFRKPKPLAVLLSVLATTALVMGVRHWGWLQPWELAAYDQTMRLRPNEPEDQRFLIVEVTEDDFQTLTEKYGRDKSILPDAALEALIAKLKPYQPRVIGLDLYRDFKSDRPALSKALQQNPQIIGICKLSDTDDAGAVLQRGIKPPFEIPEEQIGDRVGFSDFVSDPDGSVRRHLLVNLPDPKFCPTLNAFSLVIARRYLESQGKPYQSAFSPTGKYLHPLQFSSTSVDRLQSHSSGYQDVDVGGYQTLLNYRIHQSSAAQFARRISLGDVLAGKITEQDVKDRIVLVGITAASAGDIHPTPFGSGPYEKIPGVMVQAQMISQIVSATLDGRPLLWWLPLWGEVLWVGGWALVGGAIVWCFQRPERLALAGAIAIASLGGMCYLIFVHSGGWLPLVPATIAIVLTGASAMYMTQKFWH